MTNYLYQAPFISKDKSLEYTHYTQTLYTDQASLTNRQKLDDCLVNFMLNHKFMQVKDGRILTSPQSDMSSFIWWLNWANPRGLVDESEYRDLLRILQREKGVLLNEIIILHSHLGMMIDSAILNTLCHNTLTSIQLIPYDTQQAESVITWDHIHVETPFVWLLIYMQMLHHQVTSPLT